MNKIKVVGLGLFFSLFFVACTTSSSSSSTPSPAPSGETRTLSAIPESLSFAYGETDFKISQVTSKGTGKYSASSNNKSVAEVYINSVGLVRVRPTGVGNAEVTIVRAKDSSYDSASQTIKISVNKQEQNLKVNLGTTASDRWKLSNGATATISVAARSVGGVKGDSTLVGSKGGYSITKIESSTTGDQEVVTAVVDEAGEIIITAESIGDATVTVSNAGDSNYNEDDVTIFITVNDATTQTVLDFTNTGDTSTTDITYGAYSAETDKNITVTGGSAGDFSVKSSNTEIVTAVVDTNGGLITITPKSAGTAVITVTRQGGDSGGITYNPISKDIRVSINKPVAEILSTTTSSFSSITYNKLDDTDDSVVSGSSSAGDYYIKSSKPDVATASITALGAITVLFEQVGTTDITITRAGDYGYRLSSAATIAVKIIKAAQTLAASPSSISATYTEGTDTTSITITGGEGTGNFDTPTSTPDNNVVDITRTSITPSGTLTIALNLGGTTNITVLKRGDRNYEDSNPLEIGVTINQAPQTISIKGNETSFQQQLDSDPVTVEILGAKGIGDYTIDSNSNSAVASADFDNNNNLTLTLGVIGSTVIEFSRNGNRNYADSNSITITVEVTTQANQKLTLGVTGLTVTYQETISADVSIGTDATGTGNAIEARSDDESVAGVTIIDATSIKITFVNAGKTTIFVYRAGNANFNPSRTIPITVTVEQASQEIVVATTDVTLSYGETFETPLSGGLVGYEIESIEPEGVVSASIGGSNSDELTIEAIGSGTAEIKVFASGNRNYAQSESKLINFTVNRAAQELTASPSTFSLVYNEIATSALTTTASSFADEGEYVVSNNTNIVTTDINQESGILSLRAVGVTDTTVTITITKQQDIRYEAATIEIAITKVIRSDQPLASSVIGRLSFDKPGDTTTVTISDGLSGEVYTATSDNTNIVTAAITDRSLTITAVASGDAAVTVQRATGDNYNAADLIIQVRVKTQQTLSLGAVPPLNYKYDEDQRVGTITGGQGTGGYQSSSTPTGIVTTNVDANGVLFITTVSTGDTTISIYKEGDANYNQSATVNLSVSVARGVVALEYETDATTIEYSPTMKTTINFVAPTVVIEPNTVFTYAATTSDNTITTRGHKIGVRLLDDASIEVSTVNADPDNPATITVTRARTPYYEASEADVSVRVIRATRALTYTVPNLIIGYQQDATAITNLIAPTDVGSTTFRYTHIIDNNEYDYETNSYNKISVVRDPDSNDITVTVINASDAPANIIVTRVGNFNYKVATAVITVRVNKANLALEYDDPIPVLPYSPRTNPNDPNNPAGLATATIIPVVNSVFTGVDLTYTVTGIANNDYDDGTVLDNLGVGDVLTNGNLTVTALNASPISTSTSLPIPTRIRVTRAETQNYDATDAVISVTVEKATRALVYNNPNRTIEYQPNGAATETITLEAPTNVGNAVFSYTHSVEANGDNTPPTISDPVSLDNNNNIIVTAQNAHNDFARIRVTRLATRNYNADDAEISVKVVKATLSNIAYKYSGTNIPIADSGEVAVDFFTSTEIKPDEDVASRINEFTIVNPSNSLHLNFSGTRIGTGIIGITSETLNPVTLTLSWEGRNYEGSRTFEVTTSKGTPIFEYTPSTVTFSSGETGTKTAMQSQSRDIIFRQADVRYTVIEDYDKSIIESVSAPIRNDDFSKNGNFTIKRATGGVGSVDLTVNKTFSGSSLNYYNPVSTTVTVNAEGLQFYHTASTDAVLGDYSGLTTVKKNGKSYLFIAGQPISGREVSNTGTLGAPIASTNTITASADSITSAQIEDNTYIFTANRQKSEVRVYRVENNGGLRHVTTLPDTPSLAIGGASALTTAVINNKLFLFVAGSSDNGFSAFRVTNRGSLTHGGSFTDGEDTNYTFEGASALTTAVIDNKLVLFVVGHGEDKTSWYSLSESEGAISLTYVNFRYSTGKLSLATFSTDTKFFLYAANTTGIIELKFSNNDAAMFNLGEALLHNMTKDTFATVAQKGTTNFLFGAYGSTLKAYSLNDNGVAFSAKATNIDDGNSEFGGVSSLTTATIGDKLFLFVAGSSDNGVSVFEVRYLAP